MKTEFEIIDIDRRGTDSIIKPDGCVDYSSTESEADFLGKNGKILLRITSKHSGYAHDIAKEIINQLTI